LLFVAYSFSPPFPPSDRERLRYYRKFFYGVGSLVSGRSRAIDSQTLSAEERAGFEFSTLDRFRLRTRCLTDSGVIGTNEFVHRSYHLFQSHFASRHGVYLGTLVGTGSHPMWKGVERGRTRITSG
jgi:hypothetical protein